jgi:hypothetical protein
MSTEGSVRRLIGIYHADGGIRGELTYVIGKLVGTAHCSLCDITHGRLRAKPGWRRLVERLAVTGVILETVHLNERTPDVARASEGRTPCVLAETGAGFVVVLGPDQLEAMHGDVEAFADALMTALPPLGATPPA